MATQLQLRKGNTAQTAVFTGALAEVTVDTDQKTVVVHDGTTVGGTYIITKAQLDSNVSILQGVNTTQNTNITAVNGFAAGAFNTANGANGLAAGAFNLANTNSGLITIIQGVDLTQNNDIIAVNNYAQSAFAQANTNATNITAVNNYAASAYNTANGANGLAAGAYNHANAAYSYTTTVEVIAQSGWNKANGAYDTANAANGMAVGAYNTANGANGLAQGAYNTANGANGLAASAYNKANTGGTFTGSVVIDQDLTVSGNVTFLGNVISQSAQDLIINDPLIYVANNNPGNTYDIGLVGNFNDGVYQHTGIVRDASSNQWKLFSNVVSEPTTTVDFTYATWDDIQLGTVYGNVIAQNVVVNGVDFTSSQATQNTNITAVNNYAAGAYALANTSVQQSGSTMTGTLTVPTVALNNALITSNTFTTSSTAQVTIDSFSASAYRSAKYQVQIDSGVEYHVIELRVVHDGTTTYLAQYGEILTNSSLGTFDTDISGGLVRLLFTGVNSVSTIKLIREAINI